MIKQFKVKCWFAECDNCNEDVFGNDFIAHYETKKEIIEYIADENIYTQDEKIFCSKKCLKEYLKNEIL